MKLNKYLLPVAFAALMTACDSCDIEPVIPPVQAPVDTTQASMTILEFKQKFWTTQENSMELIGNMPDGSPTLLRGRVVSTDVTGNCYKQLVLRDETAAITMTVNISDMYLIYPYGAEFLVDVSSLYVGMYKNFMQVGAKEATRTSPYNVPEDEFKPLIHGNGWPKPEDAKPIEVDLETLNTLKQTPEGLQEWQSQLVTINDVEFETPGYEFSPTYGSTVSQYVRNGANRIILRFSGRSAFAHRVIPAGKGSVTGILSYYNSDWQIIPCTLDDLQGFTPAEPIKKLVYKRATQITDGEYLIWSDNVVATPLGKDYGYIPKSDCTPSADGTLTSSSANLYTFKKEAAGWTIADSAGKYVYMKGTFTSFNLADAVDASDSGYFWNITAEADGSFSIVNVGKDKTIRYSAQHSSFGSYPDPTNGTATYLYQPVK